MWTNTDEDVKLPVEYPFRDALNIYKKRLALFFAIVLANVILLVLFLIAQYLGMHFVVLATFILTCSTLIVVKHPISSSTFTRLGIAVTIVSVGMVLYQNVVHYDGRYRSLVAIFHTPSVTVDLTAAMPKTPLPPTHTPSLASPSPRVQTSMSTPGASGSASPVIDGTPTPTSTPTAIATKSSEIGSLTIRAPEACELLLFIKDDKQRVIFSQSFQKDTHFPIGRGPYILDIVLSGSLSLSVPQFMTNILIGGADTVVDLRQEFGWLQIVPRSRNTWTRLFLSDQDSRREFLLYPSPGNRYCVWTGRYRMTIDPIIGPTYHFAIKAGEEITLELPN